MKLPTNKGTCQGRNFYYLKDKQIAGTSEYQIAASAHPVCCSDLLAAEPRHFANVDEN
jgi:hypothetical protein